MFHKKYIVVLETTHTLEIIHGLSRELIILFDGVEVFHDALLKIGTKTFGGFQAGPHFIEVLVKYHGFYFKYDCFINGYSPYTGHPRPPNPIPMSTGAKVALVIFAFLFGFFFGFIALGAIFAFGLFAWIGCLISSSHRKKHPESPSQSVPLLVVGSPAYPVPNAFVPPPVMGSPSPYPVVGYQAVSPQPYNAYPPQAYPVAVTNQNLYAAGELPIENAQSPTPTQPDLEKGKGF
eukprot:TRINITY_DN4113_c0_g1_i1.p1 TRINITY_DN4113_c0_g1~~TRINITY_DN4113_c0_g1_i1.p1  ORF type:complete len:235 (+),score=49.49 TRINITY_DN4113_c0_g1_i1:90-794(+)